MASTEHFQSGLNKWLPNDKPMRTDFVSDNELVDRYISHATKSTINLADIFISGSSVAWGQCYTTEAKQFILWGAVTIPSPLTTTLTKIGSLPTNFRPRFPINIVGIASSTTAGQEPFWLGIGEEGDIMAAKMTNSTSSTLTMLRFSLQVDAKR